MGSHCHRLGGEYRKNASISNGNNIDIGKNQKKNTRESYSFTAPINYAWGNI